MLFFFSQVHGIDKYLWYFGSEVKGFFSSFFFILWDGENLQMCLENSEVIEMGNSRTA